MLSTSKSIWGFDPRTVPGCCLWLDGNDPAGTGTQPTSGAAVTTWVDKSGSNNSLTAAGTTPTFSNTSPGSITFGGAGYYSNASPVFSGTYTAFFVYKQTAGNNGPLYTTADTGGYNGFFGNYNSGGTYLVTSDSGYWSTTTTTPFPFGTTQIATTSYGSNAVGGAVSLYANGSNVVTTTQTGTITYTAFFLGRRNPEILSGTMYEVLAYNSELTTSQRQQVEGYLAWRWGLQSSLSGISGSYTSSNNSAVFTVSGAITISATTTFEYFAVGGGGGGGFFEGGGGGGGGYQTGTLTLTAGTYNVVIGQGGAGGSGGVKGGDGTNTTFGSTLVVAFGGGGGATSFGTGPGSGTGIGSGGGGAYNTSAGTGTQGGNGAFVGTASLAYGGGGGGAGGNATNNVGGPGILYKGSYYGGGGGGGGNQGSPGAGGIGGGGGGGGSGSASAQSPLPNPTAGTNGLGGGGGGQGYNGGNVAAGGSGCFIMTVTPKLQTTHPFYTIPPFLRTFQPVDIPGCAMWLDAADASTVTLSGSSVTQWDDKSGNGRNLTTQGTSSYITLTTFSNNPAIWFNNPSSQNAYMTTTSFPMLTTGSVFMVFSPLAYPSATWNFIWSWRPVLSTNLYLPGVRIAQSNNNLQYYITYYGSVDDGTVTNGNRFISYFDWTGGASSVATDWSLNGATPTAVTVGRALSAAVNQFDLGSDSGTAPGNFYISELIMFSSVLTSSQRQQVEGYLAWKWGLVSSLPRLPSAPTLLFWADACQTSSIALVAINSYSNIFRNILTAPTGLGNYSGTALTLPYTGAYLFEISGWRCGSGNGQCQLVVTRSGTTIYQRVRSSAYTDCSIFTSQFYWTGFQRGDIATLYKNHNTGGGTPVGTTTSQISATDDYLGPVKIWFIA